MQKPIREALTYYLYTHEENQLLLSATHDIAKQHIRFSYGTYVFVFEGIVTFSPF
jgi:hypothetical protein